MRALFAVMLALGAAGCGRPFDVKTAPGFVELDDQPASFAYRSISSEGVVVAVRVVDDQAEVPGTPTGDV